MELYKIIMLVKLRIKIKYIMEAVCHVIALLSKRYINKIAISEINRINDITIYSINEINSQVTYDMIK